MPADPERNPVLWHVGIATGAHVNVRKGCSTALLVDPLLQLRLVSRRVTESRRSGWVRDRGSSDGVSSGRGQGVRGHLGRIGNTD